MQNYMSLTDSDHKNNPVYHVTSWYKGYTRRFFMQFLWELSLV